MSTPGFVNAARASTACGTLRRARRGTTAGAAIASAFAFAFAVSCAPHEVRSATGNGSAAISEVTLSRSGCYAACPADAVTFRRAGTVAYDGAAHVTKMGRYGGRISGPAFAKILAAIARAKFFALTSTFGAYPRESSFYTIDVKRGTESTRVQVNDAAAAPRPLRDLAGLLSNIRDTTELASSSPINAVVGNFYGLEAPDREIVVSIGPVDDTLSKGLAYTMDVRRRVEQPCGAGSTSSRDPLAAVEIAAGAITGDGYTVIPRNGGIRISNARETVDLEPVQFENAPDLTLQPAPDPKCPTTIGITNDGDVTMARPAEIVTSNVELDGSTVVARAHFRCDAKPEAAIGVEQETAYNSSSALGYSMIVFPTSDLVPGKCKLLIDAGAKPKGVGRPAASAESEPFYYVPKR